MSTKMLDMPRKRSTQKTETTRVTEQVARMIEIISVAEAVTSSEVSSPILEKALKARYLAALDKLQGEPEKFGMR